MTPALEALGRRAVACKAWRWTPGMLGEWPVDGAKFRVVAVADDGLPLRVLKAEKDHTLQAWGLAGEPGAAGRFLPVLTDPATLGALLALVREAWGDPGIYVACIPGTRMWCVRQAGHNLRYPHPVLDDDTDEATEAAALVAALEAAP